MPFGAQMCFERDALYSKASGNVGAMDGISNDGAASAQVFKKHFKG